jgi:hypothetical protein
MCEVSDPSQVAKTVNEWPSYLNDSLLEVLKNSLNFEKMTPVQVNTLFSRVSSKVFSFFGQLYLKLRNIVLYFRI